MIVYAMVLLTQEPGSWKGCWPVLAVVVLAVMVALALLSNSPDRPE